jgi:hypothetical protein
MTNQTEHAALLDVRLAMARVFERERLDRANTFLIVQRADGFVFVYPGAVYGIDVGRGVVWENPDVPGVDARRYFDLHGRDLDDELERLRGLVRRIERRRP